MRKAAVILPILVLLFLAPSVYAHGDNRGHGKDKDGARVEMEFEQKVENPKFELEGQKFEISGEVTSISGNSFIVLGQTVVIDLSKVAEFEQKGILAVGNTVKVEGIIENGTKFAREIKVLGTGAGQFKFEIRGLAQTQITPSPTPVVTPTPSATSNPSVSPSQTPTTTPSVNPSSNVRLEINARGPVEQVVNFIKQILALLEGFVS